MNSTREFDLVLQGATGFTGQLAAEELALRAPKGFRWAVAGRDKVRTLALAQRFGVDAVIADAMDQAANDSLASRTQVVLTCAGPFSRYGKHLADACVKYSTHYADISGELPWIDGLIRNHHHTCVERGISMIPASGFDSVPSDLGFWELRQHVGAEIPIRGFFTIRGGFNGGTLHSGIALAEDLGAEALPRATQLAQCFAVPSLGKWATPFLMAPVNEDTVARSEAWRVAQEDADARHQPYLEYMLVRGRMRAKGVRFALRTMERMFASRFGRSMLQRFGPKPGQGPSEEDIRNGFARLDLLAGPLDAPVAQRSWNWEGDPSNRITVHCLVQTGLALASSEAKTAGVVTPSVGLGDALWQRLLQSGAVGAHHKNNGK